MAIKEQHKEEEFDASLLNFQLFETAEDAVKDIKIEIKTDDKKDKK